MIAESRPEAFAFVLRFTTTYIQIIDVMKSYENTRKLSRNWPLPEEFDY